MAINGFTEYFSVIWLRPTLAFLHLKKVPFVRLRSLTTGIKTDHFDLGAHLTDFRKISICLYFLTEYLIFCCDKIKISLKVGIYMLREIMAKIT